MHEAQNPVFDATVELFPADAGGPAAPIADGYRPMIWFGSMVGGQPHLHSALLTLHGSRSLAAGEKAQATLTPVFPEYWRDIVAGSTFVVSDGRNEIGHGQIEAAPAAVDFEMTLRRWMATLFESWIATTLGSPLRTAAARDLGADATVRFRDSDGNDHMMLVQAKTTRPTQRDVESFAESLQRAGAERGLLVSLDPPTFDAEQALLRHVATRSAAPRVIVLTVADLAGETTPGLFDGDIDDLELVVDT